MKINLKTLTALWIVLLAVIAGISYITYLRINPETFIAYLNEQAQRNHPGTNVSVEKIDYSFSVDFNINLHNVRWNKSDKLIAQVAKLELKAPWWLLIFKTGNAQININDLDLYIDQDKVLSPLEIQKVKKDERISTETSFKVAVPDFLTDARYTFRAKNVSIKSHGGERRYLSFSKLLVREFQYGKNSAFELNIPIEITHGEIKFTSDLWLFGDVTPSKEEWKFNYRGEFRTLESSEKNYIEDVVLYGSGILSPKNLDINSSLRLQVDKVAFGTGTIAANEHQFQVDMSFKEMPLSFVNSFYQEIKNPYLSQLKGTTEGAVKFYKKFSSAKAEFNGKFTFDGPLEASTEFNIPGKWQLSFQNFRWETSFITPKGDVSFFRRSFMDSKQKKVVQYTEELGFTGIEISKITSPIMELFTFINEEPSSHYSTTVSYKKCLNGDKVVDANFNFGVSPAQKVYEGKWSEGDSGFSFGFTGKSSINKLEMNFKKFNFISGYNFFMPFFNSGEAVVDGSAIGNWKERMLNGIWKINLSLSNSKDDQGLLAEFARKTLSYVNIVGEVPEKRFDVLIQDQIIKINSLKTGESNVSGQLVSNDLSKSYLVFSKKNSRKVKVELPLAYWEKDL